ncbi:hypothetical protein ABPG75_006426 [Micractinium tetrahymenae]
MAAHQAINITALPDSALAEIFLTCGKKQCAAFSAVCRRWRDNVYSEPRLWDSLAANVVPWWKDSPGEHQRWLSKWCRLLGRVGGVVRQTTIRAPDVCCGWEVAAQLLPLLGPQLEALRLLFTGPSVFSVRPPAEGEKDAAAAAQTALLSSLPQRFPQLALLHLCTAPARDDAQAWHMVQHDSPATLRSRDLPLPAVLPAALAPLPLLHLRLDSSHPLPDGLVASLPASLTWLRLASAAAPLPPLGGLTALQQLACIEVVDGRERWTGMLAVPPPAGFPLLQLFKFHGSGAGMQVAGAAMSSCILMRSCQPGAGCSHALEVKDLRPWGQPLPLAPVLAALLPSSVTSLEALTISDARQLSEAAVGGCSQLASLRALRLDDCAGDGSWLGSLTSQAPGLTSLRLDGCGAASIPPEVVALRNLREMSCMENGLESIPAGPYLTGLERLELWMNGFASLPAAALAAATACSQLGLGSNPLHASLQELTDILLDSMPALARVDLGDTQVDSCDLRQLSSAAHRARRQLVIQGDGGQVWSSAVDEEEGLCGGGYDSSDSDSSGDGCPRYSWAGCAYASHW